MAYEEELQDTWGRSALSIPAISFADHRKGEGVVDGILLPCPSGKYAGRGYHETAVMEPMLIQGEENPKFGEPRRWRDGRIMQQTVLTMLTPFRTIDLDTLVGEKACERFETAAKGGDDDELGFINLVKENGLRRLFIQGESMQKGFEASVKATSKMPMPGGMVTCVIDSLEPNKHGGRTKIYMVKYSPPTPASLEAVEKYLRTAGPAVNNFLHVGEQAEKKASAEKPAEREYVPDADEGDPPF